MRRRSTRSAPPAALALLLSLGTVSACGGEGRDPGAEAPRPPASSPASDPRGTGPEPHYPRAPAFSLPAVGGGTIELSDYRGKVLLIDFWATWCGPCRAAIPHLNALYAENREAGFEVLGISVDQDRRGRTGLELVEEFTRRVRMDYPIVMGNADVVRAYGGIRSIPTAFLIDRSGRVRQKYVGLRPKSAYEKDVKALLAERSPEDPETI